MRGCRELTAEVGTDVAAVAVTAATHNAVLLDRNGLPVRPCITLRDLRAAPQAERLDHEHRDEFMRRAGNRPTAGWTLPQLRWVAEHEPDIWARVARVTFAKDFVRASLTGDTATDWIDAEGSLLLHRETRRWDELLCGLVPVDPCALPEVVSPTAVTGRITRKAARRTGLREGTPVVAGCSDTAAEALAAGAIEPEQGIVKIATSGNVNVVASRALPSPDHYTYSHLVEGLVYHSYGTSAAASAAAWLQKVVGAAGPAARARLEREAAAVPAGADGLLFQPYLYGERAPVFDPTLRASFLGLAAHHTRAHLMRAVMEGVALSLADCAGAMAAAGLPMRDARLVGGGARSALWSQLVTDALGVPLMVPPLADASAGAALVAGVGVGAFADAHAAGDSAGRQVAIMHPDPARRARYAELLELYRVARERIAPLARALQGLGDRPNLPE